MTVCFHGFWDTKNINIWQRSDVDSNADRQIYSYQEVRILNIDKTCIL